MDRLVKKHKILIQNVRGESHDEINKMKKRYNKHLKE